MSLNQIDTAKELLNNTDATTVGVLLALCVILITALGLLWKKLNAVQEQRVKDAEDFRKVTMEMTEKTITAINQVTELAKRQ
ncbi:hypothetical protein [Gaetbulibacter sp. PBL-D1]|uniref:hypothetical protein n=1 Tax=Gaetbulibacter sp. PBL-D1 TaxID=3422594 RepID=UPI003D2F15E8